MDDDIPDFIKERIIDKNKEHLTKVDEDDINILFGIVFGIVIATVFAIIITVG